MGAASTAIASTSHKLGLEMVGGVGAKGASIKVITVTGPASYDAGGSALDLSGFFPNRVYWAVLQSPFFINASTGALYAGLVPGTAKGDADGGYASNDWKIRFAATATESSGAAALNAYTGTLVACGY